MGQNIKAKIKTSEVAELLGCEETLVSKLKGDGVISSNEDGTYNASDTISALFRHYRMKSGDIDLKNEKTQKEIEQKEIQNQILKIKKSRLDGTLVEFDLINKAFIEIAVDVKTKLLDADVKITRIARTPEDLDEARKLVRKEIESLLRKLSEELNPEDYDGVSKEELEDESVEEEE